MNAVAKKLLGVTLPGGWKLASQRRVGPDDSGGTFSHGFIAKDEDGKEVFVKVLDIRLNHALAEPLKDLELRIGRFNYEAEIASVCAADRLSRVAHAIEHGYLKAGPDGSEEFPYLVFERAAGDLRNQVVKAQKLHPWVAYRVIHNVAVALQQLHGKHIAHQDIKPSNVLDYSADGHKLGDFGSAHSREKPRPGPVLRIAGDPTYAPPEQLYSYAEQDWVSRRLMSDVFHLGSLIVFLLTGDGATAQLLRRMTPNYHWKTWSGSLSDLIPVLRRTTSDIIESIAKSATGLTDSYDAELRLILRCLLEPEPRLRGYPLDRSEGVPNGMQRIISKFDVFAGDAQFQDRRGRGR